MKDSFPYPRINRRLLVSVDDQLVHAFKELIMNRELPHGYMLPAPHKLAEGSDVTLEIAKHVYDQLVGQRIVRRNDKGDFFVQFQPLPSMYYSKLATIFDVLRANAVEPMMVTLSQDILPSTAYPFSPNPFRENERLIHVRRLYTGNQTKMVYLEAYFSLTTFPRLDTFDFTSYPLFRITDEIYKHPIKRYRHHIHVVPMPGEVAKLLDEDEGIPTLCTIAEAYDDQRQILYVSRDYAYANYSYQNSLKRVDFQHHLD